MCSRISSHPSPITTCCHDYEPWLRPLTHKSLSGYLCGLVVVGPCEMYPTFMINRWWNGGYCIIFIMHCESRVDVPRSILFVTCLHNFKSILTFAFNTVHATYSLIDLTLISCLDIFISLQMFPKLYTLQLDKLKIIHVFLDALQLASRECFKWSPTVMTEQFNFINN